MGYNEAMDDTTEANVWRNLIEDLGRYPTDSEYEVAMNKAISDIAEAHWDNLEAQATGN